MTIGSKWLVTLCSAVTLIVSCSTTTWSSFSTESKSFNNSEKQRKETLIHTSDQLTIAEYGLAAQFLGTWEIRGQYFLDLDPEGLFRLKNFFMAGDPDPRYWYQLGFWYVKDHKLFLETTNSRNSSLIPSEFLENSKNLVISKIGFVEGYADLNFGDTNLKKIETLGSQHVQNYRLSRSRLTSNPVEMVIDNPITAKRLKLTSSLWGNWEANSEITLSLNSDGNFFTTSIRPNMGKTGWFFTGNWFVDEGSVILTITHRAGIEPIPRIFLNEKLVLKIVPSYSIISLVFDFGKMTFMRKIEE